MFKNSKLSNKFNLLLFSIFLGTVILSGIAFSAILSRSAEAQVTDKASLLLQTMLSVRAYTIAEITPELAPRLKTDHDFLPQTVPAYSARQVAENLRTHPEYKDFFYKEATLNPTNLRDKADGFEADIVERFRNNPDLKEQTGYRSSPAQELFYIARPIAIKDKNCLNCHSTPDIAPASQISTYGKENGYGWKLGDIVGAQIISVPASDLINSARQASVLFVGILTAAFAIALLIVNLLLKRVVINPLNKMATTANEISMGNMEADFVPGTSDEIGRLASAFGRMKTSLLMAMDMLNQKEE
jgi:HAMP domain-containing protein